MLLKPDYIKEQIKRRKGVCAHHGYCALSVFNRIYNIYYRKCLTKKDYISCLRWKNLPAECRIYPLDEKDKIPETRSYCNFYWDE